MYLASYTINFLANVSVVLHEYPSYNRIGTTKITNYSFNKVVLKRRVASQHKLL